MFETNEQESLDESLFEEWLENGRTSKLGYQYLIVVWDTWDHKYQPIYVTTRDELIDYIRGLDVRETFIAAYDVYSESRVLMEN